MPKNSFVTQYELSAVKDDVADLKEKDAKEDEDIKELRHSLEELKRDLGNDEEISTLKEGADRGRLAFKVLVWAGSLFAGAIIIAFVAWMLSGLMTGSRPDTDTSAKPSTSFKG